MADHKAKATALLKRSGYASGGKVHSDAAEDRAQIKSMVKPSALEGRARGGSTRGKHSHVTNVIVAPQGGGAQPPQRVPVPVPVPGGPPGGPPGAAGLGAPPGMRPPMPGGPPPGLAGGLPPGVGRPPGMKRGGGVRKRADGGDVDEPVQGGSYHKPMRQMPQKQDYRGEDTQGAKRGGGVKGYPIDGGAGGGEGRLEKAKAYGGRAR